MIEIKNIHKSYGSLEVLKGIDAVIEQGEIVSIVGASGAGKTTLLQIVGTLDKPDCGEIYTTAGGWITSPIGKWRVSETVTSDSYSSSTSCCPNLRLSKM